MSLDFAEDELFDPTLRLDLRVGAIFWPGEALTDVLGCRRKNQQRYIFDYINMEKHRFESVRAESLFSSH